MEKHFPWFGITGTVSVPRLVKKTVPFMMEKLSLNVVFIYNFTNIDNIYLTFIFFEKENINHVNHKLLYSN